MLCDRLQRLLPLPRGYEVVRSGYGRRTREADRAWWIGSWSRVSESEPGNLA